MVADQLPSLLLIGHGTRTNDGVDEFHAQISLVREIMDASGFADHALGAGFLEFAEPPIDRALDELVAVGATRVVAVPLLLLAAGHMKIDGPDLLARARGRHPSVEFTYARDLGVHPTTLSIAGASIEAAVGRLASMESNDGTDRGAPHSSGTRVDVKEDGTAVVLVGRGSTDPDANADLYKIARLLSDNRGLPLVEPAFVSLASPGVTAALERVRKLGARRIAMVPYFLFSGVLTRRIADEAQGWALQHPGVAVECTGPMGPDRRFADLVVERYAEALKGPAAMNCDCCVYRVALPGYQSHVHPSG